MMCRWALLSTVLMIAGFAAHAAPLDYRATISPVNSSGVTGTVDFVLDGSTLSVDVELAGLSDLGTHYLHIHGLDAAVGVPMNTFPPPPPVPPNGDLNKDGVLNTPEAKAGIGNVILSLAAHPLYSVGEFVGVASTEGSLSYKASYDLANIGVYEPGFTIADLLPLDDRVFDLHGGIVPLSSNPMDGVTGAPGSFDVNLPVGAGKILSVAAVPEPASLALLCLGVAGAAAVRRRRPSV